MNSFYIFGGIVAAVLLVVLIYALFNAEEL